MNIPAAIPTQKKYIVRYFPINLRKFIIKLYCYIFGSGESSGKALVKGWSGQLRSRKAEEWKFISIPCVQRALWFTQPSVPGLKTPEPITPLLSAVMKIASPYLWAFID